MNGFYFMTIISFKNKFQFNKHLDSKQICHSEKTE